MLKVKKELEETRAKLVALEELMKQPVFQKAAEAARVDAEKRALYDQLVKQPFKYEIIKDFIEAAQHGVVVKFVIDGVPIEIKKEAEEKKTYSSPLF